MTFTWLSHWINHVPMSKVYDFVRDFVIAADAEVQMCLYVAILLI